MMTEWVKHRWLRFTHDTPSFSLPGRPKSAEHPALGLSGTMILT